MNYRKANRVFLTIAVVAAASAVAAGFFLLGSPRHQREASNDNRRLQDIQQITSAAYAHTHPAPGYTTSTAPLPLPATLDELAAASPRSSLSYIPTKGPQTGRPYEYHVIDKTRYELCAVFETDSRQAKGEYSPSTFWSHPAGRFCFTLDVATYPSVPAYPYPSSGPYPIP